MRILIANDQHWPMVSGVATATRALARGLAARGHEVLVIAPSQTGRRYEEMDGNYRIIRTRSVPIPFRQNLRIAIELQNEFKKILETFQPDIVHVHTQLTVGLTALRMARKLGIPVVATNHVMPENILDNLKILLPLARPINHIMKEYGILLYKGAEHIVMPTQSAIDMFNLQGMDIPFTPMSNGIDLKEFKPGTVPKAFKQRFGLPLDKPIVTYLGRLDKEKHVSVLLRAMVHVRQQLDAHTLIVGQGNDMDDLRELAKNLGLQAHVTFTGLVDEKDKPMIQRCATVYVMPSPAELQSLATLEAMASGQPLVAVNAGALPELCHDGKNGFLYDLDDDHQMADKLLVILQDKTLRQRMSRESVKIASRHDIEHVIDKFEEIYRDVIKQHAHQKEPLPTPVS